MPFLFPYWDAPEFVQCPNCHVGFECTRIGVTFDAKKQYTIKCHCGQAFNVDVEPRTFGKPVCVVTARD